MNPIVRRVEQTPEAGENADELPAKVHRSEAMTVTSELSLGMEPRLQLSWSVKSEYWAKGFTLLVFHNTTGFCPEKYPTDLNRHGSLIIETTHDGAHHERPAEGKHYFTFVLHQKTLLGLLEKIAILRFSETVPTAKIAIGRVKDQIDLQDMLQKHDVGKIEHEAKINEAHVHRIHSQRKLDEAKNPKPPSPKIQSAADALIAGELMDIDAMVETFFAKRTKIADLKHDPRFQKLSRTEQKAVLKKLGERLDPADINAKREMEQGM